MEQFIICMKKIKEKIDNVKPEDQTGSFSVLVIDDDQKLGNLLKSFLTEKGYLVDFVENTLIAKEKLFNIIFD